MLTLVDPAVATGLVSGALPRRLLPRDLRRTQQIESGLNDGLALPLVLLAALLATVPPGTAVGRWLVEAGRDLGLAVLVGPVLGLVVAVVARRAADRRHVAESFVPLLGVATAVLALTLTHLLRGSGILVTFFAGLTLSLCLPGELHTPVEQVLTAAARLGLVATFLVFGTVLPLAQWAGLGVAAMLFVGWVLLLRRPPVVAAALLGTRTGPLSRAYLAWFGPLGVAAIYYLAYVHRYALPDYDRLFAVGTLTIATSVVVSTFTSTPAVHAFAARADAGDPDGPDLP